MRIIVDRDRSLPFYCVCHCFVHFTNDFLFLKKKISRQYDGDSFIRNLIFSDDSLNDIYDSFLYHYFKSFVSQRATLLVMRLALFSKKALRGGYKRRTVKFKFSFKQWKSKVASNQYAPLEAFWQVNIFLLNSCLLRIFVRIYICQ